MIFDCKRYVWVCDDCFTKSFVDVPNVVWKRVDIHGEKTNLYHYLPENWVEIRVPGVDILHCCPVCAMKRVL